MNASTKLRRRSGSVLRPSYSDHFNEWGIDACILLACLILCVSVAIGIYAHATRQPAWLNAVLQQCIAENRTPHVEKARDGTVLAVRCDREPERGHD